MALTSVGLYSPGATGAALSVVENLALPPDELQALKNAQVMSDFCVVTTQLLYFQQSRSPVMRRLVDRISQSPRRERAPRASRFAKLAYHMAWQDSWDTPANACHLSRAAVAVASAEHQFASEWFLYLLAHLPESLPELARLRALPRADVLRRRSVLRPLLSALRSSESACYYVMLAVKGWTDHDPRVREELALVAETMYASLPDIPVVPRPYEVDPNACFKALARSLTHPQCSRYWRCAPEVFTRIRAFGHRKPDSTSTITIGPFEDEFGPENAVASDFVTPSSARRVADSVEDVEDEDEEAYKPTLRIRFRDSVSFITELRSRVVSMFGTRALRRVVPGTI